jgi:DNA-binding transcriptional MerR regulator
MPIQLSTRTAAALCGASVRRIDYWARTGLLRPSVRSASGRGTRRLYSFRDLIGLKTICKLREGRCPLQQIRSAVRYLADHFPEESGTDAISRLTLLTDGKKVYMLSDEHEVMEVVTQQRVWSVPLGKLILDSESEVDRLWMEWAEIVAIGQQKFHLLINRDAGAPMFAAECRELPGLLVEAPTVEEVVANARKSIEALMAHRERKGRRSPPGDVVGTA